MYELWIYSKRQAKWVLWAREIGEKEMDHYLRVTMEFERTMQWALLDGDGLLYWRKGDSPEAIMKGIAMTGSDPAMKTYTVIGLWENGQVFAEQIEAPNARRAMFEIALGVIPDGESPIVVPERIVCAIEGRAVWTTPHKDGTAADSFDLAHSEEEVDADVY